MQYGGWYDNPETGKNQRWFDGTWTDGAEPSQSSGLFDDISGRIDELIGQNNSYIDSLISSAQGDYDFIIEQLMNAHEKALGSDDSQLAEFLESVADELEKKIGRIPYDYQVGVTRVNEDKATATERALYGKDTALKRLAEDEQVWKRDFGQFSDDSKVNQQEELLRRGIIQGTRADARGLAGENVQRLDTDLGNQLSAYERALGRERTDIVRSADDALFDINRGSMRSLQDLKTGARRGAIDQVDETNLGKTKAQRELDAKKKILENQRKMLNQQAPTSVALQYGNY